MVPAQGVCTWVKDTAELRGMEVILFEPDLSEIRAWFEVPKRYYQRNKEMIEACDALHAFISAEDGYTGGTRFEIEYAVSLNIPVQINWENGVVSLAGAEGKRADRTCAPSGRAGR